MGHVLPLGFSMINDFAYRFGITGQDFDTLLHIIQQVDAVWMSFQNKGS